MAFNAFSRFYNYTINLFTGNHEEQSDDDEPQQGGEDEARSQPSRDDDEQASSRSIQLPMSEKNDKLYKFIVNFLRKANPEKMLKGEYLECIKGHTINQETLNDFAIPFEQPSPLYYLRCKLPYRFEIAEYQNIDLPIARHSDVVVGLYFPNALPGCEVRIVIGGELISKLVIEDPTKIYLPIDNLLFINLICLQFHEVKIFYPSSDPFYVIGMRLDNDYRIYLATISHCQRIYHRQLCLRYAGGMAGLSHTASSKPGERRPECKDCTTNSHLAYHANKIKRAWRYSIYLCKKAHKQKWKLICQEIKAFPGRGVDYFEGKRRFEFVNSSKCALARK